MDLSSTANDIAIIGMSGRFPGAPTLDRFWQNIRDGVESITFFAASEPGSLRGPATTRPGQHWVGARGTLDNIDMWDAAFFGLSPRDATLLDPQQRLFMECAWEALESAGYTADAYEGVIGLYAGVSTSTYVLNLYTDPELVASVGQFQIDISNDKDFLPTRVSYKLNLKGPSIGIQTACSTSLVAIHLACQSLLNGECDMALAGGVRIRIPTQAGYFYQDGGILSPDGHCRAFDRQAAGTVGGDGAGVVVIKRLTDALADGDTIAAVIKGSAVNNDGALKMGYTAPSVEGQAAAIVEAMGMAGVEPETISYVEAHGTGTVLGDPIEIEALTRAFTARTDLTGFCAIGSVKTNIGHLDAAAGVAGLIKTVLALQHKMLPPSLHFEQANPQIDFASSPFYVQTKLSAWREGPFPRRAGVSSFGIGGTNAHLILEEAPEVKRVRPSGEAPADCGMRWSRPWQLLLLSAKTTTALASATDNLAAWLQAHADVELADVAATLQRGRRVFQHRRVVVGQTSDELGLALKTPSQLPVRTTVQEAEQRPVVFMFPGQGAQYVDMAVELYQTEPTFRRIVDHCAEWLMPLVGFDLRSIVYPHQFQPVESPPQLQQTQVTQPVLFVVEYALARLWMEWGVSPQAMIGHSLGDYVAATLAGVFSLEDALSLVVDRGRLMQSLPRGEMLAIEQSQHDVAPLLNADLSLAAVNSPSLCVLSGTVTAIAECEAQLMAQGVTCQRLHTSHAFHSVMMDAAVEPFAAGLAQVDLQPPRIPLISTFTGRWMTEAEATDPYYWAEHLRQPVHFSEGLATLQAELDAVFLEVGPGQTLSTFYRQQYPSESEVVGSLHPARGLQSDSAFILASLGQLWLAGVQVDWDGFYTHEQRRRLPLPTYPFERQRYWAEARSAGESKGETHSVVQTASVGKKRAFEDWFYTPVWRATGQFSEATVDLSVATCWLVLVDAGGLGAQLVRRLRHVAQDVIAIEIGASYTQKGDGDYTIHPSRPEDYEALVRDLRLSGKSPQVIAHMWLVTELSDPHLSLKSTDRFLDAGLHSLVFLTQALGKEQMTQAIHIGVVSNQMQIVDRDDDVCPAKAMILGACRVIPQEYPNITCQSIDLVRPQTGGLQESQLLDQLLVDLAIGGTEAAVAYRGTRRLVQELDSVQIDPAVGLNARLRQHGVYLITGGLGGIGFVLAEYLANVVQARLILTGRSAFPRRELWEEWRAEHGPADRISRMIQKILELERNGAECLIYSADVSNREQMQRVVAQAEEQFGQIHGVIHAAGVPDGAVIPRRTREMTEAVLAPKVQGFWVLDQLLDRYPLDFWVLCSSLSSVLAPVGQLAYCAANAFLDAMAQAKAAQDNTYAVAINWDSWKEVGMALESHLQASSPFPELSVQEGPADGQAVPHPLFDYWVSEGDGRESYVSYWHGLEQWVLSEHRIQGEAVLPGTAYLEMVRAAFARHAQGGVIEYREVYFLQPCRVGESEVKEVRTILTQEDKGWTFVVRSRVRGEGETWQEHARGELACVQSLSCALSMAEDSEAETLEHTMSARATGFSELGPRWDNMQHVRWSNRWGVAQLELPERFAVELESYQLHPALFDMATGFLSQRVKGDDYYLPFYYKKIRIKGPLPRRIISRMCYIETPNASRETLQFDGVISDMSGTELVEIEGYTLRRVELLSSVPTPHNAGLEIESVGGLETMRVRSMNRSEPQPGEVEIEVYTVGLNVKDVLLALGVLPHVSNGPLHFGMECAGRIVRVGGEVTEFVVGDAVIAFVDGGCRTYVTTSATNVVRKPAHLGFEAAATLPVAYLTAYYSLVTLGRLSRGERVLIHAASGGEGLAAVTIAKWIGAEIFATAGSPEERAFLQELGVSHVMDSRTLAFADTIMERTGGQGVDVVLNSLAGEFIPKSLSVVAMYGRFLEIGLRDIVSNRQLGMRAFEKSIAFFAVMAGPGIPQFKSIWAEVIDHIEHQRFDPLPYRTFDREAAADAFLYMAEAKHIGKVVMVWQDSPLASEAESIADEFRGNERSQLSSQLQLGLTSAEGVESFVRILNSRHPQVIVSTQDLEARLEQAHAVRMAALQSSPALPDQLQSMHHRPDLTTAYVAPQSEVEETLINILQTLLGIEQIGVHDDFFELGGHSLLAIQVLSRVRAAYDVDLPLPILFDQPTAATLAATIDAQRAESRSQPVPSHVPLRVQDGQEASDLLAHLDDLSDAEVEALLKARLAEDEIPE